MKSLCATSTPVWPMTICQLDVDIVQVKSGKDDEDGDNEDILALVRPFSLVQTAQVHSEEVEVHGA